MMFRKPRKPRVPIVGLRPFEQRYAAYQNRASYNELRTSTPSVDRRHEHGLHNGVLGCLALAILTLIVLIVQHSALPYVR